MYSTQQSNLVSAYGNFISQWPWDHYATLTFGRRMSQPRCLQHWDEFIDSAGRLTHGRVAWVRADEQRWSGFGSPQILLHFHALLKYQNVPAPEAVTTLWKSRSGDAKVEFYDPARGAAWYLAKMFPYEDTRYNMGGLEHFPRSPESRRTAIQ
jgi:hypothetical protein